MYNLSQKLTSSIFWHYVSNQYFPLKTFDFAQDLWKHFDAEIREKLWNKEIPQREMLSLYNIDNFDERIKMCKEKFMTEHILQTAVLPIINDQQNIAAIEQKAVTDESKSKDDANNIDWMISFCERYLDKIRNKNSGVIGELSDKLKTVYDPVSRKEQEDKLNEEIRDAKVAPESLKIWNLHDIYDMNNSIYFDVASVYLEDCQKNLDYYLGDPKNILADSWFCTRNEEDYLHYVANKHQERNEVNTKKLLQRITEVQEKLQKDTEADSNLVVLSHPLTASLLNERRQKEEDAKCSICGSGDYEENDLIVFCGFWGIAVHQCWYGVEELPDGEWFCISWYVFGKKKGRNLKCMLCSKYGGAMKPTNVLALDEFFKQKFEIWVNNTEENKNKKYGSLAGRIFKTEKKNATLASIINYEHNNLSTVQTTYNTNEENENDNHASFYDHMDENLNYRIEKEHLIETKYAWAHMSWANFIPEIEYTPKSPLKIGKLLPERFEHACIIWWEKKGAAIKWSQDDWDIWMHGEWARRAGYYMECGKVEINEAEINNENSENNNSSTSKKSSWKMSKTESLKHKGVKSVCKNKNLLKIFCERHRPLKIIKEIKDKFESATEELQKFWKTMRKALDVMSRIPYKCK